MWRAALALVLVAAGALIPLLGPSAVLRGTGEAAPPALEGVGLLRGFMFAALSVHLGDLFVSRLTRRVPGAPCAAPRDWAPVAAWVGVLASLGLASVVATGNLVPHRLADMDIGGLYRTRDGALALVEVNAFVVAGACALSRRAGTAVLPLAAVVVAESLRAHPEQGTSLLGAALTFVHLTCGALWTGGLLQVLRLLWAWRRVPGAGGAGAVLLGRYARIAGYLLAVLTVTGVLSALRRMPPGTVIDQLGTTAYGRTLLAKVVLVGAVALLALVARRSSRPARRLGAGAAVPPDDVAGAFAPARAEVVGLGAVVMVSGLLTALPLPIRW
ncbi:hypothetical protein GBW32_07425 [Streptomyces tsukubensis]|nr:CopD family protein [Streptomyces tsukubensis]QFR97582.1 hypothetical protein GBW32_07425 [Streptomyces tsukubensis]